MSAVAPAGRLISFISRVTCYYPSFDPGEGGYTDRHGKPLFTLQQYLDGNAPFVSCAMDLAAFPYGTILACPDFNKHLEKQILLRVVDTGDAFIGMGLTRLDLCVKDKEASLDDFLNARHDFVALAAQAV